MTTGARPRYVRPDLVPTQIKGLSMTDPIHIHAAQTVHIDVWSDYA